MKLLLIALTLVAATNATPLPEVHSFDVASDGTIGTSLSSPLASLLIKIKESIANLVQIQVSPEVAESGVMNPVLNPSPVAVVEEAEAVVETNPVAPASPVTVPEVTPEADGVIGVITPGFESFPVNPVFPVIIPDFETPEEVNPTLVNVVEGENNMVSPVVELNNLPDGVNNIITNNQNSNINFVYFYIGGGNTGAITNNRLFDHLLGLTSAPISPEIVPGFETPVISPAFSTPEEVKPYLVNIVDGENNPVSSVVDLLNLQDGVNNVVSNNRDTTVKFTYFFIRGDNTGAITGNRIFKREFQFTSP